MVPDVIDVLRGTGIRVDVHVQDDAGTLPRWIDGPVVALRGLRSSVLRSLLRAEEDGTRFVDPPSALLAVRDRGWVHERLAEVGVVVPAFRRATTWDEVRQHARCRDVIVKHGHGGVGRGRRVEQGALSSRGCRRARDAVLRGAAPSATTLRRLSAYEHATRLRLAAVYAFRPAWHELARRWFDLAVTGQGSGEPTS